MYSVYAAGDSRDKKFQQITTAISDGTIAAMEVIHQSKNSRFIEKAAIQLPFINALSS